jgi:hypothetical protein
MSPELFAVVWSAMLAGVSWAAIAQPMFGGAVETNPVIGWALGAAGVVGTWLLLRLVRRLIRRVDRLIEVFSRLGELVERALRPGAPNVGAEAEGDAVNASMGGSGRGWRWLLIGLSLAICASVLLLWMIGGRS